ncbi:MAG: hypothetical protein D6828_04580, partial [Nitrospirae bacterium]
MSFYGLLLSIIGFSLVLIPHFILPLSFLKTHQNAYIKPICFYHYHPEFYLGLFMFLSGALLAYTKKRIFLYTSMILSMLIILSGIVMKPMGYYLGESERLFLTAQYQAINSHKWIREFIICSGIFSLIISVTGFFYRPIFFKSMSITSVVLAQLRRKALRSFLLLLLLGITTSVLFTSSVTFMAIENSIDTAIKRFGADLLVVHRNYRGSMKDLL